MSRNLVDVVNCARSRRRMALWSFEIDFKDGNKPTYLGEFDVALSSEADASTAIGVLNAALINALTPEQKKKVSGGFAIYFDKKCRMFKRENLRPWTNDQPEFADQTPKRYPYQTVGKRVVAIGC